MKHLQYLDYCLVYGWKSRFSLKWGACNMWLDSEDSDIVLSGIRQAYFYICSWYDLINHGNSRQRCGIGESIGEWAIYGQSKWNKYSILIPDVKTVTMAVIRNRDTFHLTCLRFTIGSTVLLHYIWFNTPLWVTSISVPFNLVVLTKIFIRTKIC